MVNFFDEATPEAWQAALDSYPKAIDARASKKGKKDLPKLDSWWRKEFPQEVAKRYPPHATKKELLDVLRWKATRNSSRPFLKKLIEKNSEKDVRTCTEAAFKALGPLNTAGVGGGSGSRSGASSSGGGDSCPGCGDSGEKAAATAIAAASKLYGVGPATATALLTPFCEALPFLADEAIAAVFPPCHEIKYTLPEFKAVYKAFHAKAAALGGDWTAEGIGRALWAFAQLSKAATGEGDSSGGRGGRGGSNAACGDGGATAEEGAAAAAEEGAAAGDSSGDGSGSAAAAAIAASSAAGVDTTGPAEGGGRSGKDARAAGEKRKADRGGSGGGDAAGSRPSRRRKGSSIGSA